MIVRTAMEVNLGDGRKEYVDSKVYNVIRHEGYMQGRTDAIDEIIKIVKDHSNTRIVSAKKEIYGKHHYYRAISQSKMVRLLEQLKEKNND